MSDRKIRMLLLGMALHASGAHAEIYIINQPTLETVQTASPQAAQFSLNNIDVGKIRLLQRYQYADRAAAADKRRQRLGGIGTQLAAWEKNGAAPQENAADMGNTLSQIGGEARMAMEFLNGLTLPELKQLYETEQKNEQLAHLLLAKLQKISPAAAASEVRPSGE